MKTFIFLVLLFFLTFSYAQTQLVFNDDGFINIENDAYLVIDNPNANAITLNGTGGHIISESEENVVKWNVENATGNYIIPFTNTNFVKIPVEIDITSPGSTDGSLILSTYRTDNMNTQWPTVPPAVTNMCSMVHPTDASYFVVDRFWRIDANSYASKPSVEMSLGYDFTNEAGGNNTIAGESSLRAQRFNPNIGLPNQTPCQGGPSVTGNWENLLFGMPNTANKEVNSIVVSPSDFFKDWILVDQSTPLPVTLLNFNARCEDNLTILKWSTASENNNDYFVVEKSTDGISFSELGVVQGNGNSSNINSYSFEDRSRNTSTDYYRLKQVDYDGTEEYFDVISSNCLSDDDFIVEKETFVDKSLELEIYTTAAEKVNVALYDYSGQKVANKKVKLKKGNNQIYITDLNLVKGIYMLNIIGEQNDHAAKLFKH